jgi:hypothetical protein
MLLGRPQNAQMPAPADLDTLTDRLAAGGGRRSGGLSHGVGQRLKVV